MKYVLSEEGKIKYSPQERELFKFLSSKEQSSKILADKFYKSPPPFHGQKIIIGIIRNLRKKIETNREPFRVASTDRSGPIPMAFWLETK